MKQLFPAFFLLALVMSCRTSKDAANPDEILSIVHGTSFGHCRGYCIKEIRYEPGSITYTQTSRDSANFPPKVYVENLTRNDYSALTELLDKESWKSLDSVINCPDCADRGAEYLIITTSGGTKKVRYDAWSNPNGMESLLTAIREKRKLLEKELEPPSGE